jgi:DUF2927 family protein
MRALALLFSVLIGLSACATVPETTKPKPRPGNLVPATPSIESQQVAAYYASVQARLRAQGRLRQDTLPKDAPFTVSDLVANFERVALFEEYSERDGKIIARQTASSLRRWQGPIRIGLYFGDSVSRQQRAADTAYVRKFAAKLARLSGVDIKLTSLEQANFSLLFMNLDEQRNNTPDLARHVNFLEPQIVREIQNSPRGIFCVTYAVYDVIYNTGYKGAVILIKDEYKGLMRKSCIEEEMTQALGLTNDSPDARPSIFNDDEEFALLTRHDELLLQMLYDPRLSVGMTQKDAHPIIQQIALDLMSSGQS